MELLLFKPIYKERIWGGQNLSKRLGRKVPALKSIGESWEIVDRLEDQSLVASGTYSGQSLNGLLKTHGEAILGPKYIPEAPFPILVKWLDCKETLSIQVHPPKAIAKELGGQAKTENWYVLDSQGHAKIYLGLRQGVSHLALKEALEEEKIEPLLNSYKTKNGDSYLIESGTIHSIGGGNLILEIQENSDTTYRVYDWKRLGLNGSPRKLHIKESLKSIIINDKEIKSARFSNEISTLAECPLFRIKSYELNAKSGPLLLEENVSARLIHVVDGNIYDSISKYTLRIGDNALLPFDTRAKLSAVKNAKVLITDQF